MTVSNWIATSSVVVALLAFTWQVRRARFNQSIDLLFRIESDFFGTSKVAQRALAAKNYLANRDDFFEMEDILDFFETIGMLTRKGALDIYMVWHTFDYWIERYYAIALPYILERQAIQPGAWEDIHWLVRRLKKLQANKGSNHLDEFELVRFLDKEFGEA